MGVDYLLYLTKVPVRVAGGLLFELLGQSAGDPFVDEDDIPIVLRSWQAQNFLITALHVKGPASSLNVLGITEVQVRSTVKNLQSSLNVLGIKFWVDNQMIVFVSGTTVCGW